MRFVKNIIGLLFVALFSLMVYPAYLYLAQDNSQIALIQSPLPLLLTKIFPKTPDFKFAFVPKTTVAATNVKSPQIYASAALSYDLAQNKLLFAQNIKKKLPIASLTKIATAIVAIENENLKKILTVSKKASEIGENSMGLEEGERLSLEELLYGLILLSGNDAAETIAQGSSFGRENFVYLMNKKTEDLGLGSTHFTNPTGLEGDGKQYSTVYDLLVITKYALENPTFAKIVSTIEYNIEQNRNHKAFFLFNETNLLTSYPGVKGVKTGYTFEAGLCLVTYLEYGGHKIISILLNSENRRQEMKDLLDFSLKSQGIFPPPHN